MMRSAQILEILGLHFGRSLSQKSPQCRLNDIFTNAGREEGKMMRCTLARAFRKKAHNAGSMTFCEWDKRGKKG